MVDKILNWEYINFSPFCDPNAEDDHTSGILVSYQTPHPKEEGESGMVAYMYRQLQVGCAVEVDC